jgi:CheY-like chemotaxis protein
MEIKEEMKSAMKPLLTRNDKLYDNLRRQLDRGWPKIMVIEDDLEFRDAIEKLLTSAGYGVETFSNGKAALARLKHLPPPSLIFLDMMMPNMNGVEFMKAFLKLPLLESGIVVYLCSATASAQESSEMGCHGFLRKPLDGGKLLRIADNYCETLGEWRMNYFRPRAIGLDLLSH